MGNGWDLITDAHPWECWTITLRCTEGNCKENGHYFCYYCNFISCEKHCRNFGHGKPKICESCLKKHGEIQQLMHQEFNKFIQDNCGHFEVEEGKCIDCHKDLKCS